MRWSPSCDFCSDTTRRYISDGSGSLAGTDCVQFHDIPYKSAIANGATVLVVAHGQLIKVSKTERVVLRSLEPYGTLEPGTHIKITNKSQLSAVS